MKKSFNYLSSLTTAVLCLAAASLRAEAAPGPIDDIKVVTLVLKLSLQSPGYNSDNGAIRTFDQPLVQTLNAKNLLDRLALDKQMQGLYGSSSFPSGAKLGVTGDHFVVVRGNNELIVDVSDIVTFSTGTNDILSGATNNSTGLANPKTTELTLLRLNFDDTFISGGSGLKFFVQGVNTTKTKDSTPNATTGKYSEQSTDHADNVAGEGTSGGTPFIVTGIIQGNRKTALTYLSPSVK